MYQYRNNPGHIKFHVQGRPYTSKHCLLVCPPHPWDLTVVVGVETDGHTQGYNNPPVLRRLVGGSHIPPVLSPAYTRPSENIQVLGWLVNLEKIRTGTKSSSSTL